jgi:hypothetical protein
LRASRSVGLPLLADWGIRDRYHPRALLAKNALHLYEVSLCRGCGHSAYLTYDQHINTPKFWLETPVCVACEPMEEFRRNTDEKDTAPGEKLLVRNKMTREDPQ